MSYRLDEKSIREGWSDAARAAAAAGRSKRGSGKAARVRAGRKAFVAAVTRDKAAETAGNMQASSDKAYYGKQKNWSKLYRRAKSKANMERRIQKKHPFAI